MEGSALALAVRARAAERVLLWDCVLQKIEGSRALAERRTPLWLRRVPLLMIAHTMTREAVVARGVAAPTHSGEKNRFHRSI